MMVAVRIRLEGCLIDDATLQRGRIHIERIGAGEVDFNGATEILHDVDAAVQEAAIKQDISRGSLYANAVQRRLEHLHITADGVCLQLPRTSSAYERTVDGLNHHIAIYIGKLKVCADRIKGHIAMHAL